MIVKKMRTKWKVLLKNMLKFMVEKFEIRCEKFFNFHS